TRASTEGLSSRLATVASVIRDGVTAEVPGTAVVPGDLVVVAEGDAFPADGIVVAGAVQVDESALTGEAMPIRWAPWPGPFGTPGQPALPPGGGAVAIDDVHWGFAGTRVLAGEARVRVGFTGAETIYGEIVRSAQAGRHERTPLQRSLDSLV